MSDLIRKTVYDSDSGTLLVLEDRGTEKRIIEEDKSSTSGLAAIAIAAVGALVGPFWGFGRR